jgi:hypothetical protein
MDPKQIQQRLQALQPEHDRALDVACCAALGRLERDLGRVPTEAELRKWLTSPAAGQAELREIISAVGAHVSQEWQRMEG